MDSELATRNNTSLANPAAGFGDDEVSVEDIELPRVRLTQAMSQAVADGKAKPGEWFYSLHEASFGSDILFVPVKAVKNRVRLVMGEGLKCRSLDMIHGKGDPGILCETCQFKEWPNDRRARGEDIPKTVHSPECTVSHNWLGLVIGKTGESGKKGDRPDIDFLEEPQMAVVQWRSTATQAAKRLNTLHQTAKLTNDKLQWWERTYRFSVQRTQNDRGTFFVPAVALHGKTEDSAQSLARNLHSIFFERQLDFTQEAVQESQVEAASPEDPGF